MISAASRYARNTVQSIDVNGSVRPTIMPRTVSSRTVVVTDYTWKLGDRVDVISARSYGDETLWWIIADANPQILDWTDVPSGTTVRIPLGS